MENNDNIEIDLQELAFIVLNAESNYNTLKEKTTALEKEIKLKRMVESEMEK